MGEAGYTLTELLVVLVILVMLVGLVGPQLIGYLGTARSDTARLQLSNIEVSLDLYLLDAGGYPDTETGLVALVEQPATAGRWHGPYLKKRSGLLDPWGNPYEYRSPGQEGAYDLYSLGADNVPGGEDEDADITNWE